MYKFNDNDIIITSSSEDDLKFRTLLDKFGYFYEDDRSYLELMPTNYSAYSPNSNTAFSITKSMIQNREEIKNLFDDDNVNIITFKTWYRIYKLKKGNIID